MELARAQDQQVHTNNSVEGWHNGFQTTVSCSHPSMSKLLCSLQREQSLQEANSAKWEAGEIKHKSKVMKMQDQRLQNPLSDYENRDTLGYLRGIARNFDF